MQIVIDVKDDYIDNIYKLLDSVKDIMINSVEIKNTNINENEEELSDELISRIDDIKNAKVKTLSRDEIFDEI